MQTQKYSIQYPLIESPLACTGGRDRHTGDPAGRYLETGEDPAKVKRIRAVLRKREKGQG
ncbi:MAG: hypothetical protein IT228_06320 [Flavobacteriales bacterium]|nr:hypothetical protein [Flavobacteriales bacterium]MCC6576940.1 hypothetical protein [Flavobacteriales bacterium]NUQ16175.1 hypothetical protein [Flavobacteriales bacterium]